MTWRAHMTVELNALRLTPLFGPIDQSILILLPVAAVASILPDIDATGAKIHFIGGGVLGIFRGGFSGKYFHHRGLMHSLPVTIFFFIILILIFRNSIPALPYIFALSYFSHSLIDGFNTSVGYLYPFIHKRFALLPKTLRSPVGGSIDNVLFFTALLTLLLYFFLLKDQFFPPNLYY